MNNCLNCGKPTKSSKYRFCSMKCSIPYVKILLSQKFKGKRKLKFIEKTSVCEKCKKKFTYVDAETYSEKRFCSRRCANSKVIIDEVKKRIASKLRGMWKGKPSPASLKPKRYCRVCKVEVFGKMNYCNLHLRSSQEFRSLLSEGWKRSKKKKNCGGLRKGGGRGKQGWYRGYWCGSSYELVYVIYNLEHNISFERNKRAFEYIYEGEKQKYYPDFIENGKYVEIKGYMREGDDEKLKQFPKHLKVLTEVELRPYFKYVVSKYGKDFVRLYELPPSVNG